MIEKQQHLFQWDEFTCLQYILSKLSGYEFSDRAKTVCIHLFDAKFLQARPHDTVREIAAVFHRPKQQGKKKKKA